MLHSVCVKYETEPLENELLGQLVLFIHELLDPKMCQRFPVLGGLGQSAPWAFRDNFAHVHMPTQ
jgi:hypothetical protein